MISWKLIGAFLSALLLGQISQTAFAREGSLTLPSDASKPVELNLTGVNLGGDHAEYSELLQVFVGKQDACCTNRTPIAGQYEEDAGVVKFVPIYEFIEGQDYVVRVRLRGTEGSDPHTLTEFNIQSDALAVSAQVTKTYPSGDSLPENVLRFYIHFSKPMKPHVAFDYIKLVDATGKVDDAAFMKFKQELWSEDRKRLTLLMDPGRIKRNVSTNLRIGPALLKDQRYSLVVEGGWPAANGEQALTRYAKPFIVSDGLRELPDVDQWVITAPALGTYSALEIKFDRPFDHQLLHTDIKVVSESGSIIPGEIVVSSQETEWRFQPNKSWVSERITVVVDSELEDVAGNNFRDLLDHSIETETKQIRSTSIVVDLRE